MNYSDEFKELALASGRHINCKIIIGNDSVFYDDSILGFDFDDITHTEYFTIGTVCSNEFSFSMINSFQPEVGDMVRPYISFDGAEWCQLGVFYIARRYFRGKYASFVCYDKMNDLDVVYTPNLPAASSTVGLNAVLQDICGQAGLTFVGQCDALSISKPPSYLTYRMMIGYIAMLNCACAKFNKSGELVFKKYSELPTATLSCDNCFKITRNITKAGVSSLKITAGSTVYKYGRHEGLSLLELRNPFMTQSVVDSIGAKLSALRFYGAEIEMQGLPFLEAGDFIRLSEDDGTVSTIVMSEIKYHYDGALTAKLFSKNKADSDTVVYHQEFEDALAELWSYIRSKL